MENGAIFQYIFKRMIFQRHPVALFCSIGLKPLVNMTSHLLDSTVSFIYQKTISTNELTTLELPSKDIWFREGSSGSVVECMTGVRGAAGLSLTRETVLSP